MDFSRLKNHLLLFMLTLVFSVGLMAFGYYLKNQARQDLKQIESALAAERARLYERQDAVRLFRKIRTDLYRLTRFSLAPVDKLKWLETLQGLAGKLRLPALDYQIKARQVETTLSQMLSMGDWVVYVTPVTFKAGLVYDEQLLMLLDGLRQADLGVFSVERCQFKRLEKTAFAAGKANLDADCTLSWYSLAKGSSDVEEVGLIGGGI